MMNKNRPKHLALHKIKLPLPGLVSILHRISGALLFLALPLLLWLWQASLQSIATYTQLLEFMRHPLRKVALLGLLWAFMLHFCAGIRFLALDLHYGSSLAQAHASSRWVLGMSVLLTIVTGAKLC